MLVCIDKKANCYDCFEDSRVFAVNLLGEHQEHLANRFATKGIEKFQDASWHMSDNGIPVLDETIGHIECAVTQGYDGGDHTIYLGEVIHAQASGDRPLLFFKGKYAAASRSRLRFSGLLAAHTLTPTLSQWERGSADPRGPGSMKAVLTGA